MSTVSFVVKGVMSNLPVRTTYDFPQAHKGEQDLGSFGRQDRLRRWADLIVAIAAFIAILAYFGITPTPAGGPSEAADRFACTSTATLILKPNELKFESYQSCGFVKP